MISEITIGQYYTGDSLLHRMDPRMKFVLTFLLVVFVFACKSFFSLALVAMFTLVAILFSSVPLKMILRSIKPIVIIILFTAVLNIIYTTGGETYFKWRSIEITEKGINTAIFMAVRIILLVVISSLLTYTTTPTSLTDAIERLLSPLSVFHISVTWLLAISGGLSTGIGFASKDIIENLYYGASLMAGRIKVGDWVEVDGRMGKVASISYTSTTVESIYGEVITYQNAQLFKSNYKNLTRNHGYLLSVVPFGVAYGSNLKQVTELVEEALGKLNHPWMDSKKPVKCVVSEMGESSVNFKLFVWTEAHKRSYVISDVLKCVYDTLNQNGISIPFPQRDVHIIEK